MISRVFKAVFVFSVLIASSAQAFVRSQTSDKKHYLSWSSLDMPIAWKVESSPPGGATNRAAVIDAFNKWTTTSCAEVSLATPGSLAASGRVADSDGESRVFFQPSWSYGSSVLGLTTNTYQTNGTVLEADVEFNIQDWDWMAPNDYAACRATQNGCVDTASVAVHESGHFFGLDHSPLTAAVMYASWGGDPKRDLANDDIQGICAIYPKAAQGTGTQGSACLTTTDCQTGLVCASKQGASNFICTKSCTGSSDTSCPGQTTCQKTTTNSYACEPSAGGMQGDTCSTNSPCAYGYWCIGTGGSYTCREDCDPQGNDCPGSLECIDWAHAGVSSTPPQNETLGGFCRQPTGPTYARECEACTDVSDCATGLICVPFSANSSGGVCRSTCSADDQCGDVQRCLPRDTFQTNSSVCACNSDLGQYGAPCLAQNKCDTGLVCVNDGTSTDTLCRTDCGGSSECPSGQYCKQFGSKSACVKGLAPKVDAGTPDDGSGGDVAPGGCSTTHSLAGFLSFVALLMVALPYRRRTNR